MHEHHMDVEPRSKRVRGKGKKPTLVAISVRLDREVAEYFNTHHKANVQGAIRQVLANYVKDATRVNFDEEK